MEWSRASINGPNEYPPYEVTENSPSLSRQEREELRRQHDRFKIFPRADMHDLTIGDCPSTVPYNSSKRTLPKQQLESKESHIACYAL